MNKLSLLFVVVLFTGMARAQLLKVSAGTGLTILSGTVFNADGLTLTPSANFIISNNTLNKSATVINPTAHPYISRVYQFTNNTNPFSGSVQINYTDGAELNGIPESALILNVHNGTSWITYPATTRDGTNNFVLTNGVSSVTLKELTYAHLSTPLHRAPFIIIGNPATNDVLIVQVNNATGLALYTADGKLLWQEQVNAGIKYIDVSRYAKGAYLLKANYTTQKVVVQ